MTWEPAESLFPPGLSQTMGRLNTAQACAGVILSHLPLKINIKQRKKYFPIFSILPTTYPAAGHRPRCWLLRKQVNSTRDGRTALSRFILHLQTQGCHHQEAATGGCWNFRFFICFLIPTPLNIFTSWGFASR